MHDVFNLNAGWCASICSVKGVGSIDTLEGLEVEVEVKGAAGGGGGAAAP